MSISKELQSHRVGQLVALSRSDVALMEAKLHAEGVPYPTALMPRLGPVESPQYSEDDADYDDDELFDMYRQEEPTWV